MPDTVCTNSSVAITNTSSGGSSWYWNFCMADLKQTPQAVNLGNIGGVFSQPVFIDICSQGGNYYGLVVNHYPGGLSRLDFGNSLLNSPTATYLGNFGGIINAGYGSEGIQIANAGGKWTALIIGGNVSSGGTPRLVKVDFGPDITNPAPVATNWGDLGGTDQAVDLYLFQENGNYHAYTVSAESNAIVRYDFGADFSSPPTAVNLGNPGNSLNYPTGICPVNDGGQWRLFIANGSTPASIVRLDFGNSLLNTPKVVQLGNPQNAITSARSIRIIQLCDQVIGFVTDGSANTLVRLDFNNDLTSIPTALSLGNLANFNFPHSLSKLFRVGADLYSFIPNAFNNTMARIKFEGCTNSSLPSSTAFNPPAVSYTQPGTYHVNMIMDDGLPTQSSFCRTVTVVAPPPPVPVDVMDICAFNVLLPSRFTTPNVWSTGETGPYIIVNSSGSYSVSTDYYGCSQTDDFTVTLRPPPKLQLSDDAIICQGGSTQLSVSGADNYKWFPANSLSDPSIPNPIASPAVSTVYLVQASVGLCGVTDSVKVTVRPPVVFQISPDKGSICTDDTLDLTITGGDAAAGDSYSWLSDPTIHTPVLAVSPDINTTYQATAYDNVCHLQTPLTAEVTVRISPTTTVAKSNDIDCIKGEAQLSATGGIRYAWYPASTLSDSTLPAPTARTDTTTLYQVKITGANGCSAIDSIRVFVSKNGFTGFPLANAFSPNGDGINDCFGIKYWGYIGHMEMSIFNRWGQQVFYTEDPNGCWDGTYKGKQQPAGAYVCVIKAVTLCGVAAKQSTLLLIR